MTPYLDKSENEDDEWEDDGNDADIGDDSDGEPTVPCPYCHREIFEDVPQCPYCDRYISTADHAGPRKPFWVIATALVSLAAALWRLMAF